MKWKRYGLILPCSAVVLAPSLDNIRWTRLMQWTSRCAEMRRRPGTMTKAVKDSRTQLLTRKPSSPCPSCNAPVQTRKARDVHPSILYSRHPPSHTVHKTFSSSNKQKHVSQKFQSTGTHPHDIDHATAHMPSTACSMTTWYAM